MSFIVEYCTSLFKEQTIRRYTGYFKKIASVVIANPGITISGIEIISEEERKEVFFNLLESLNGKEKRKVVFNLLENYFDTLLTLAISTDLD